MEVSEKKKTRKFRESEAFDLSIEENTSHYYLLPFKFHRLANSKELLVNEVGDFLILSDGTVAKIVERKIDKEEDSELYGDLIANFFISEEPIHPLIDVLATRYRTKKSFLNS